MAQKILIDLEKFRSVLEKNGNEAPPEGLYRPSVGEHGLKSIREQAVFQMTCRKCTDAPCMEVCPADALEKSPEGIISRANNLCISCKSCVVTCPFGTMMTDFFEYHRNKENYYDVMNKQELDLLIKSSPEGAIQLVDMEEDPENNIYQLNEHILVKERVWNDKTMKTN